MKSGSFVKRAFLLYYDGFRNLTDWGKKLWILILIKGILLFVLMKFIFFPNLLKKNFDNDTDRGNHVIENLTTKK